jgi:hypothetical protein
MVGEILAEAAVRTEAAKAGAAERMRRCRARRRAGYRCLTVEFHNSEIDALVHRGLLRVDDREDPDAIVSALYEYLEGSIGQPS